MSESFSERVARIRAEREAERGGELPIVSRIEKAKAPKPAPEHDADLIPDIEEVVGISPAAMAVGDACDGIDITEVYTAMSKNKWGNKTGGGKRQMISCPMPDHADNDPSAQITFERQDFNCFTCLGKGDKYTIAAIHYGLDVERDFFEVKKRMAYDLRGVDYDVLRGRVIVVDEEPVAAPSSPATLTLVPDTPAVDVVAAASVTGMLPTYRIEDVLPERGTFLRAYYDEAIKDDSPDEFALWCGLAALGLAVGRRVVMEDSKPVTGNLAICLTGATTVGKSRALAHATEMVRRVLPWDNAFVNGGMGVAYVKNPGSGEYLAKQHIAEEEDPSTGKPSGIHLPVKSLIEFDEVATFASRSSRSGSSIKQFIMDLADGRDVVSTGSLTHGKLMAEHPFSTIVTTTQPGSLKYLFDRGDRVSGLLNRFVFPMGTPKRKRSLGGTALHFDEADERLKEIKAWAGTERSYKAMDWGPGAFDLWDETYHRRIVPAQEADQTDLLGRLDLTMKRLILLFAINDRATQIKAEHVRSAVALLDYMLGCYASLDAGLSVTADEEFINKILEKTTMLTARNKNGVGPTVAQLRDYIKGYTAEEWTRMIRNLESMGLIEKVTVKPKRGPERVTIVLTGAGVTQASK